MYELHLDAGDLAETRFAASPLMEAVLSLRVWRLPGYYVLQRPWLESAAADLGDLDISLLLALVGPRRLVPDFLTPRPDQLAPDFGAELDRARATDPAKVAADIRTAHTGGTVPALLEPLLARPAVLRDRLARLLEAYWELTLARHWPRIRGVLEADLRYRALRLAEGGVAHLFADLHPSIAFRRGTVSMDLSFAHPDSRNPGSGRGLCLVPALFVNTPGPPNSPDHPPMITYPVRGAATVWRTGPPPPPGTLAALIGSPKATILTTLAEPATTTELARLLEVTPGAVSHHLKVLHDARLVTRARAGRGVLYARTDLADRLMP
ncbi:DUF5937 family protein [Actinocorallia longicatena]|uniref:DUF5937 family protein n=1 Tax=Actinocorallia longicatena TaxID=111803 RepID=A0ABP6QL00_9ACTN